MGLVTISHRTNPRHNEGYIFRISDLENENKELQFEQDFTIDILCGIEHSTATSPENSRFKFIWSSLEFDFKNEPRQYRENIENWVENHKAEIEEAFEIGKDLKVQI